SESTSAPTRTCAAGSAPPRPGRGYGPRSAEEHAQSRGAARSRALAARMNIARARPVALPAEESGGGCGRRHTLTLALAVRRASRRRNGSADLGKSLSYLQRSSIGLSLVPGVAEPAEEVGGANLALIQRERGGECAQRSSLDFPQDRFQFRPGQFDWIELG